MSRNTKESLLVVGFILWFVTALGLFTHWYYRYTERQAAADRQRYEELVRSNAARNEVYYAEVERKKKAYQDEVEEYTSKAYEGQTPEDPLSARFRPHNKLLTYLEMAERNPDHNGKILTLIIEGAVLPTLNWPTPAPRSALVFLSRRGGLVPSSPRDPGFVGAFTLGNVAQEGQPQNYAFELNATIRDLYLHTDWFTSQKPLCVLVVGVDDERRIHPVVFSGAKLKVQPSK